MGGYTIGDSRLMAGIMSD